ncbi:MAG: asparagine synthase (glutamine-hydrolyzing) [Caulobacteraceae bacterium]
MAGAFLAEPGDFGEGSLRAMLAAVRHRGPDGEGIWSEGGAWLGQRRLAVLDLSAAGAQPMISACGRHVITANGEIYNHAALRRQVDRVRPVAWRGHCDIEVLLEAIALFGVEEALTRAEGMFAFAVWDRDSRIGRLARDRFGEKPLYYVASAERLLFASELTALERVPGFAGALCPAALSLFFRYGYVPGPLSIYRGVNKLPPGGLLEWRAGAAPTVNPWWTLADVVEAGRADPLGDDAEAIEALDRLLRDVVRRQTIADVPVGAFLSGGVDSSLVAAIMQSVSDRPVRTFTLGFEASEFSEAAHARAVATHLGTDHTEHIVTAADAQAIAPGLGALYDEPFADSSQIPTCLISALARRDVTVCLTGDGGDEMFAGYVRYPGVPRLWRAIGGLPFRGAAGALAGAIPLTLMDGALGFLAPLARGYAARGRLGPNLRKAAAWLSAPTMDDLYERTMTAWADPDALLVDPPRAMPRWRPPAPVAGDPLDAMLWRDSVDYLPGDILCKVDRAAMAVSLETRVPLLDAAVAAFAWRAPAAMKIRGGETKWLLRRVLDRYVPRELIDRPKMGFSVPLHDWLTGGLRDWAESLLAPAAIGRQGVLRPRPVADLWRRYLAGDSSGGQKVWSVLMFQSWMAARGR